MTGADREDGDAAYAAGLSLIGAGAGVRVVATIVGSAAGIAATSLVVRLLGTTRYGVVAFLMSVVLLFPGVGRLGVMWGAIGALSRAHSKGDEQELSDITHGVVTVTALSGVIGAVLVFALAQFIPPGLGIGTRVLVGLGLGVLLLGSELGVGAVAVARSLGRVVLNEAPNLTLIVGRLVVLLALWAMGAADLRTVAIAYGVTGVAASVVSWAIIVKLIPGARRIWRPDLAAARALLALSIPYVVFGLAAIALERLDVFVLGLTRSTGEVGVYEPTLKLVERLMLVVPLLFSAQFFPVATRLLAADAREGYRDLYVRISKIVYVLAFPALIALAAFPETMLRALYGGAFPIHPGVAWALLVGYGVNVAFGFNAAALAATGERRPMFRVGTAMLVTMIGLAIVLIPAFGALGAAWATSGTYVVMNLVCAWSLWRTTGAHPLKAGLVGVIATSGLPLGLALLIRRVAPPSSIWIAAGWTLALWAAWIVLLLAFRLVRGSEITPLLAVVTRRREDGRGPDEERTWD